MPSGGEAAAAAARRSACMSRYVAAAAEEKRAEEPVAVRDRKTYITCGTPGGPGEEEWEALGVGWGLGRWGWSGWVNGELGRGAAWHGKGGVRSSMLGALADGRWRQPCLQVGSPGPTRRKLGRARPAGPGPPPCPRTSLPAGWLPICASSWSRSAAWGVRSRDMGTLLYDIW